MTDQPVTVTLTNGVSDTPIATIDLGPSSGVYFDRGDLAAVAGNLYLFIDGKEYGSLFFHRTRDEGGEVAVELGQFDATEQQWVSRNPLTRPADVAGE